MDSKQIATEVAQQVLGSGAKLEAQEGGLNNEVFMAEHAKGEFVVRLGADTSSEDVFHKEHWSVLRAEEAGVPVCEIVAVGEEAGRPFMVSSKVEGKPAGVAEDRVKVACELGEYAALINQVPTTGYGRIFDWAPPHLERNPSWSAFLDDELHLDHRLEVLLSSNFITTAQAVAVRSHLHELDSPDLRTTLNHGDLRMKNVLVDEADKIVAILDWEMAVSNPAPEWELSTALHDLSIDQKTSFLRGYGVSEERLTSMSPILSSLNIVNYAPYVEQAVQSGDLEQLEDFRLRLSGVLDLFSV